MDDLTGDVRREVRCEECSNVGDVLGRTAATQGNLLVPPLLDLVGELGGHVGDDEAGGDGVGADAAGTHLLGRKPCLFGFGVSKKMQLIQIIAEI